MKGKAIAAILTLTLVCLPFYHLPTTAQASLDTAFYVDPPSTIDPSIAPGSSFTVDVNVLGAIDLCCWQVFMFWDTGELNAVGITFGDFLAGQPEGTGQFLRVVNEDGWLVLGEVTRGLYPGVDGDGWLCSITFSVETRGETILDISSGLAYGLTFYIDSLGLVIGDDPGELVKQNGYFNNLAVVVSSTLDIKPDTLNLDSEGRWITAYVELPEAYSVDDIDVSSIMLNSMVPAEAEPTAIGDFDNDGIPDLMVKFDRAAVELFILDHMNLREVVKAGFTTATLTITGELVNGTPFQGNDTIRVVCAAPQKL